MRSILMISLCLLSVPLMAESDLKPDLLASSCAACHGYNGHARGDMPVLAGMDEETFLNAMRDFRGGERGPKVMQRQAVGYTEAELKLLAAYFARQ